MIKTNKIKFIFVSTQSSIQDSKGKNFVDSFNHFAKIFEKDNLKKLENSVAICITKTESFMKEEIIFKMINNLIELKNLSEEAV